MRCGVVGAAASAYLGLQAGKAAFALRGARHAPQAYEPADDEVAGVVVVQAILSGDPGLEDALRDNLLALRGAHFVWLVDDDDPEGQRVAAELAAGLATSGERGTRVDVVTCPPVPDGVNPKLAKIGPTLDRCSDDTVVVVLDDDTRLPRRSLGALLRALREGATLATGLPGYLPGTTVWARLVEQFVDDNATMTYLTLAPLTINGMTWAMRAADLRALGGVGPLLHHLTDDLAVAGAVLDGGGTIRQTASPQWITTSVDGAGDYVRLMHRWMLFATLLVRRQPPRTAAAIGLLHGLHPGLLWLVLVGSVLQRRPLLAVGLLGSRALLLRSLQRRVHGRPLHRPLLSVAAELAQPAHLVHGALRRTIRWRTRTYRVRADDDFSLA